MTASSKLADESTEYDIEPILARVDRRQQSSQVLIYQYWCTIRAVEKQQWCRYRYAICERSWLQCKVFAKDILGWTFYMRLTNMSRKRNVIFPIVAVWAESPQNNIVSTKVILFSWVKNGNSDTRVEVYKISKTSSEVSFSNEPIVSNFRRNDFSYSKRATKKVEIQTKSTRSTRWTSKRVFEKTSWIRQAISNNISSGHIGRIRVA